MNFKEDFEFYLNKKFEDLGVEFPNTIEEIVRHIDVNYIIPLKSELFTLQQFKNTAVIEDKQRNADIIKVCAAILEMSPNFYDNPNGGYENTCPICYEMEYGNPRVHMPDIRHKQYCAYLIAKDLSTGLL